MTNLNLVPDTPNRTVYIAGELFDLKHLAGNLSLARALERISAGRYQCHLPQDLESPDDRGVTIRNKDLLGVMQCDLGLFQFDGTDLDSGTVTEFVVAKLLDIPAVLFRSDFRGSGDQGPQEDPWNLMCSFWPRTEVLCINSMQWYQKWSTTNSASDGHLSNLYDKIAISLIGRMDRLCESTNHAPLMHVSAQKDVYEWLLRASGGGLEELLPKPSEFIENLIMRKRRMCLLRTK